MKFATMSPTVTYGNVRVGTLSRSGSTTRSYQPFEIVALMQNADLLIRGGTIYDGRGRAPFHGDIAIVGDSIAAVGDLRDWHGPDELDVGGLAVAPGFVNMLSWATES